jgi:hypothetical protein
MQLVYGNEGDTDVPAPIFDLQIGKDGDVRVCESCAFRSAVQLLGIAGEGPAGVLPPGSSFTLDLEFRVFGNVYVPFYLNAYETSSTEPLDWVGIEGAVRDEGVAGVTWDEAYDNLRSQLGSTYGSYAEALGITATRLGHRGRRTADVTELFYFEWQVACGMGRGAVAGQLFDAETGRPLGHRTAGGYGDRGHGFAVQLRGRRARCHHLRPGDHCGR